LSVLGKGKATIVQRLPDMPLSPYTTKCATPDLYDYGYLLSLGGPAIEHHLRLAGTKLYYLVSDRGMCVCVCVYCTTCRKWNYRDPRSQVQRADHLITVSCHSANC